MEPQLGSTSLWREDVSWNTSSELSVTPTCCFMMLCNSDTLAESYNQASSPQNAAPVLTVCYSFFNSRASLLTTHLIPAVNFPTTKLRCSPAPLPPELRTVRISRRRKLALQGYLAHNRGGPRGEPVSYERGTPEHPTSFPPPQHLLLTAAGSHYWGYSKVRTHTALGPYGRCMPRSVRPA